MSQPRRPKGRGGGQFASKPRSQQPPFNPDPGDGDYRPEDWTWLEISEEEREELLKETDIYLAELAEKVGEPSAKHIARAEVLLDQPNGARATEAPA